MKKYALYDWLADDEGGFGVCLSKDWNPSVGYYPETGWMARPSILVGDFDTVEECAKLLQQDEEEACLDYEKRARENKDPRIRFADIPLKRMSYDYWLEEAKDLMENLTC